MFNEKVQFQLYFSIFYDVRMSLFVADVDVEVEGRTYPVDPKTISCKTDHTQT